MTRDVKVNEALALHGDSGLSWSQVYDIIDLIGGLKGIVKAGYAAGRQASAVLRATLANNTVPFPCRSHCFTSKTGYYVPSAQLRRAAEFESANGRPAVHAPNECVLKEVWRITATWLLSTMRITIFAVFIKRCGLRAMEAEISDHVWTIDEMGSLLEHKGAKAA
jgi:hypothetical protein